MHGSSLRRMESVGKGLRARNNEDRPLFMPYFPRRTTSAGNVSCGESVKMTIP
jgi:hypothetical protein